MLLPDFRKEPYQDSFNDPNLGIKDARGNYLQWMSQRMVMKEDGTSENYIMVLYHEEKELVFEVNTREEDRRSIAEISFQVP